MGAALGAEYQQPFVRILRHAGNVIYTEPWPIDSTIANAFTISVNPAGYAVTGKTYKLSDGSEPANQPTTTGTGALQTVTIPANSLTASGVEYVFRITGGTGATSAACELLLVTN